MNILVKCVEDNLKRLNVSRDLYYGVGFSAGPDSTFLLDCLYKLGYKNIVVIYINYHDSKYVDQEEKLVYQTCKRYKYRICKFEEKAKEYKSFEKQAREARYGGVFKLMYKLLKLEGILIAHQEDDLICTYLMQKMKAGPISYYGLKEINFLNDVKIIRPMLNITKKDIVSYLNYYKIPYYDDITNQNLERTRNYIRETILPTISREGCLKEIDKLNQKLEYSLSFSLNEVFYYKDYLNIENKHLKLAALYNYIKLQTKINDDKKLLAFRNLVYFYLNSQDTKMYKLDEEFALYKDYKYFYIQKAVPFKEYQYSLLENMYYRFFEFEFDLTRMDFQNKSFPLTVTNVKKDMEFSTNLVNKSVYSFLKKQKVPSYLRKFYPAFVNEYNQVIYVPFYKDIIDRTIPFKFNIFKLDR